MSSVVAEAFQRARHTLHQLEFPEPAQPPPLDLVLPGGPGSTSGPDPGEGVWVEGVLVEEVAADQPAAAPYPAGSICRLLPALAAGTVKSRDLVEEALAALAGSAHLGAMATLDAEGARAAANQLDAEVAQGRTRGPLHGIPITVKDIIDVAGLPTRAGSLAYGRVASRDAASVARLRHAGVVVLGKAATHEFALGVTTPSCRNPYDPERIAGGSSGGSAVAVATGVGLGSLGTDTRASLRVPASLCGVVGFKPSFGVVPTGGLVPLSWTVDHVGPIAGTVRDALALLEALAGWNLTAGSMVPDIGGLVVGVVTAALEAADPDVAAAVGTCLAELELLGAKLVDSAFPAAADLALANDLGLLISRAEAATFHRGAGTDLALCLPEVREQLLEGLQVSACDYLDAQRHRAALASRALLSFEGCDVLAGPTTPITAPRRDDYERFLMRLSENTMLWSLAGSPALSMPAGRDGAGLPVGLQLCAPPGGERLLARAGIALESGWNG